MPSMDSRRFTPRPVVVVEDKYQHLTRLAESLQARSATVHGCVTFVCLEKDGPDTAAEVDRWLKQSELALQVVVLDGPLARGVQNKHPERLALLSQEVCMSPDSYAGNFVRFVRPGGVLLQDIELDPLQFTGERAWLSVYAADSVRTALETRCPGTQRLTLWFMSNKKTYIAPLTKALLHVGCDLSRQFFPKDPEAWGTIAATIESHCSERFPLCLETSHGERRPVGADDRKSIGAELDIVIWRDGLDKHVVEGRLLSKTIELEQGNSPQFAAWVHLVRARIAGREGVQTIAFGHLKGLEDASESEVKRHAKSLEKDFNPSAKLADKMRHALRDSSALVARDGVYFLADSVAFAGVLAHRATYGIVQRRS